MDIELKDYEAAFAQNLINDISDFFAFHGDLLGAGEEARKRAEQEALETLEEWQRDRSALYVILCDGSYAGFLRLDYRGDQVAWIEDIYVRPALRGQGAASAAIIQAEEIVAAKPGYTALCMDVAPRNEAAIRLYYRLGYDSVSLLTLRKEFGENRRDRRTEILGKTFKI